MLSLIGIAVVAYVGFQAYRAYKANGNSVSPLDTFINEVKDRVLLKK